jgi:hypothetical protein
MKPSVIPIQKQKSRSISLNADPSGFHRLSGCFPGKHSIPPEGFKAQHSAIRQD